MHKHALTAAAAFFAIAVVAACGSDKTTAPAKITYVADLKPGNEVLANGSSANVNSTASGTWTGTLDPSTNVLSWTMTYAGLTTNSTASHIHAQAATNTTAGVVLNFATFPGSTLTLGATSGTASGSINLTTGTTTGLSITGD